MESCKDCKYRQPDERPTYPNAGYCRRFPPQLVALNVEFNASIEQHFPWMNGEEWCGEFSMRPASIAEIKAALSKQGEG